MRLPLPMAYADPAFTACIAAAIETPELVEQFDRLYGVHITSGSPAEADMRAFVSFVHDGIYLRLPDEVIHSLRAFANAMTPPARKAKPAKAEEVSHG